MYNDKQQWGIITRTVIKGILQEVCNRIMEHNSLRPIMQYSDISVLQFYQTESSQSSYS